MLLSVIVPMYKTQQYLRECLDSLRAQSLNDVEFLLIDDGSPDNCGEIAEEYAKADSRFAVLHKENGGIMSAWKAGLKISKGKYIGFVDSDDFVEKDMFSKMIDTAIDKEADIVCCGLFSYNNNRMSEDKLLAKCGFYDRRAIEESILPYAVDANKYYGYSRIVNAARVNKLFKREILISNLKYFDERVSFGDDLIATYSSLAKAQSLYVMEESLYYYRYNGQSITHKFNSTLELENDLCCQIYRQINEDYSLENCSEQIYRNAAHISFRLIANEIANTQTTKKQKLKDIKRIVNKPDVVLGAKSVDVRNAPFSAKVKFFLLRHKCASILYRVYERKQIVNR